MVIYRNDTELGLDHHEYYLIKHLLGVCAGKVDCVPIDSTKGELAIKMYEKMTES